MIEDTELIFNADTKRYCLSSAYVYDKMGTDLNEILYDGLDTNKSTLVQRSIKYASNMLYDFIEANAISPDSTMYAVTQNIRYHEAMKEALEHQTYYLIQNGNVAQESGHKMSDTVSASAIQRLKGVGLFHLIVTRIPEEW